MPRYHDLSGKQFGELVVLAFAGTSTDRSARAKWLCQCSCGRKKIILAQELKTGQKSCGCLPIVKKTDHHMSKTPTYYAWDGMIQRCSNPNNERFSDYGKRGITFDSRWKKFINFFKDMGEKPEGKSLDRIDNNAGYSKENCRWATPFQQMNNTRRTKMITWNGETRSLSSWSIKLGIKKATLSTRIERGWNLNRAMTEPTNY